MCHCFAHSFVIKLYCEQEKKAMPFGSLPLFFVYRTTDRSRWPCKWEILWLFCLKHCTRQMNGKKTLVAIAQLRYNLFVGIVIW